MPPICVLAVVIVDKPKLEELPPAEALKVFRKGQGQVCANVLAVEAVDLPKVPQGSGHW